MHGSMNIKFIKIKVKVNNQCTGLECCRRLRLPDFKTIGT